MLYRRADANETDEDGWIALSRAASKGHEAVVRQLVKYEAIVNAKSNYGETAPHQAASKGHELRQQAQTNQLADIRISASGYS